MIVFGKEDFFWKLVSAFGIRCRLLFADGRPVPLTLKSSCSLINAGYSVFSIWNLLRCLLISTCFPTGKFGILGSFCYRCPLSLAWSNDCYCIVLLDCWCLSIDLSPALLSSWLLTSGYLSWLKLSWPFVMRFILCSLFCSSKILSPASESFGSLNLFSSPTNSSKYPLSSGLSWVGKKNAFSCPLLSIKAMRFWISFICFKFSLVIVFCVSLIFRNSLLRAESSPCLVLTLGNYDAPRSWFLSTSFVVLPDFG